MPITYNNAQPLKCDNTQPLKVNVKVHVKVHDSFADVGDPTHDYFFQSRKVSAEFRRSVEAACPRAFTTGRDASFCVRLLQYLMFPSLFQQGTTRITVPCRTLAVLDGRPWTSNYRAIDRLHAFEDLTGIALDIGPWDYELGRARTVQPEWPEALIAARDAELALVGKQQSRVYFDSGEPYGRSKRTIREKSDFDDLRLKLISSVPENHPQRFSLELLNSQPNGALKKAIKRNLAAACQIMHEMPIATASERLSKEWAMAVLDAVSVDCGMAYRVGTKTARCFAVGMTLHLLPREIRKQLLSGFVTLDLKSAQLAIAARVWEIPELQARLEKGNHWAMLQNELGTDAAQKPALKTATYALLFGKSHHGQGQKDKSSGVVHDLAVELGDTAAAWDIAERFGEHRVTQLLAEARKRRMARVAKEGGLRTVFGKEIRVPSSETVKPGTSKYHGEMRSALAEELQAYEQRLMLPALQVAAARRGVTVVSYLHDGVTLHFEDSNRESAIILAMKAGVSELAIQLGVQTELEEE